MGRDGDAVAAEGGVSWGAAPPPRRRTVLHLLAQRPAMTGSGVTLEQLVRHAATAGWEQHVVVGVPAEDEPAVGGLAPERVHPLRFETPELPFPVPGMSDLMPYRSTVFSHMTDPQWRVYRDAWLRHLRRLAGRVRPDVVHAHHMWLLSSLVKQVWPQVPVLVHCHATGLRQLTRCRERAQEILAGLRRNDAFAVLTERMRGSVVGALAGTERPGEAGTTDGFVRADAWAARVHVVGAGYDETLFCPHPRVAPRPHELLYAGKLADTKGVPELLEAFARVRERVPDARLHLAGGGDGAEADAIRQRARELGPAVIEHGRLRQPAVAELMRRCGTFVLPSLYEGLPLVLVEAAACGCRIVATALPAVTEEIAPALGDRLRIVPVPPLVAIDRIEPAAREGFVAALTAAIEGSLRQAEARAEGDASGLREFTWAAVFGRVEALWRQLLARAL